PVRTQRDAPGLSQGDLPAWLHVRFHRGLRTAPDSRADRRGPAVCHQGRGGGAVRVGRSADLLSGLSVPHLIEKAPRAWLSGLFASESIGSLVSIHSEEPPPEQSLPATVAVGNFSAMCLARRVGEAIDAPVVPLH